MEEILASIRNIIADERDPARSAAPKAAAAGSARPCRKSSIPRTPPRRRARPPSRPERQDASAPTVVWRRPQVEAEPAADAPQRQRGAAAVARGERGGGLVVRGLVGRSRGSQRRTRRRAWCARCCGRCSSSGSTRTSGHRRAAGAGGDPAGRARSGNRRPPAARRALTSTARCVYSPRGACAFGACGCRRRSEGRHPILNGRSGGHRADQNSMMDKSFDFAAVEGRVSALWEETGAFRAGRPDGRRRSRFASSFRRRTSPAICIWATRSTTRCRTSCAATGA